MLLNLLSMVTSIVFDFCLNIGMVNGHGICLEPCLKCRVACVPVKHSKDVKFQLAEFFDGVGTATVVTQIRYARLVLLQVLMLGCNEQSNASNAVVILLTDGALGCIMVHKVYCEEEGFGPRPQAECKLVINAMREWHIECVISHCCSMLA